MTTEEAPAASVLDALLQWSKTRPTWQRDALRRLIEQGSLSDEDYRDLVRICKADIGVDDAPAPAPKPIPLEEAHIGGMSADGGVVHLTGIHDVQHVNRLAGGRSLSFEPVGLTVVYGDNGAGKSGYTRILKHACRARAKGSVHRDIFSDIHDGAPSARLSFIVDGVNSEHEWVLAESGGEALSSVSVFDSECASIYVERETAVEFRPFGLDLFTRLVEACDRVRGLLQHELTTLGGALPGLEFRGETAAAKLLRELGHEDAEQRLAALADLSAADLKDLAALSETVAQLERDDPVRQARDLELRIQRFKKLSDHASQCESLASNANAVRLREAYEHWQAADAAAQLAETNAFRTGPLGDVGSAVWRALWEAARAYSEKEAYPDAAFPATADARCVLCQQPLDEEASNRLTGFEGFVQQEARRIATAARADLDKELQPLQAFSPNTPALTTYLSELRAHHETHALELEAYLAAAEVHLMQLSEACQNGNWEWGADMPPSPCAALLELLDELEARRQVLEAAAAEPEESRRVRNRYAELLDRRRLQDMRDQVKAEITRQTRVARLKACIEQTETKGITRKNTELTRQAVTDALRERFEAEMQVLGLRDIKLSVEPKPGVKGQASHQLEMQSVAWSGWKMREVLSEGEHRCIALAAFLAELSTQGSPCTAVFDDPVSSLDHLRRERVAERLADEAMRRPVVVFTHDLVFVLFLEEQAKRAGAPFASRYLTRQGAVLGVPADGLPWGGKKLTERIKWLRSEVTKLKKIESEENPETFERVAQVLWGRLREAWECGVEEVLLNSAVRRFSRAVSTVPLRKLKDIDEVDLDDLERGMTEASTWLAGHDHAREIGAPMPPAKDLHDAVERLETWRHRIVKRREGK